MLRTFACVVAALSGLTTVMVSVTAQQPVASTWNGAFTDAQATRGDALYGRFCANCHSRDLVGGDRAPALTGQGFTAKWSAKPVNDLLGYVQGAMPLNWPGTVGRQQNADIVAFLLKKGGATAGRRRSHRSLASSRWRCRRTRRLVRSPRR